MGFWIFLVICTAAVPIIMIIIGAAFKNGNPKNINALSGFRTADSMKSEAAWRFANKYCGTLWFKAGLIVLPVNIIIMFLIRYAGIDAMSFGALILSIADIIVMISAVIRTQKALKKRFNELGNPMTSRSIGESK